MCQLFEGDGDGFHSFACNGYSAGPASSIKLEELWGEMYFRMDSSPFPEFPIRKSELEEKDDEEDCRES